MLSICSTSRGKGLNNLNGVHLVHIFVLYFISHKINAKLIPHQVFMIILPFILQVPATGFGYIVPDFIRTCWDLSPYY